MDHVQTLVRSAKAFFSATVLSRVSGLFRDIAMAISFGSSPEVAAFFIAYRFANLFRRLLGEGNLSAAFVPYYSELDEEKGVFYRDVFFSLSLVLIAVVAGLELVLWAVSFAVSEEWYFILRLTMWMVPGLLFICLYGLNSALLQCHKKYFLPAASPVMFNLIWILGALFFQDIEALAITVTIGFVGQWLMTVKEGIRLLPFKKWLEPNIFSSSFTKLLKPLFLGTLGVGAVQLNSALDSVFARASSLEGPAYLWYAIRLEQLPLALFGIALTSALLPPLSKETDPEKRKELLKRSVEYGMTLMLFSTFAIFALGQSGINLLFGHGRFSQTDVLETASSLFAYAVGLVPATLVLIFSTSHYSKKSYKMPTIASVAAVASNLFLNAFFVFFLKLGPASIAFATSLSSIVNLCILTYRKEFSLNVWPHFFRTLIACWAACLAAVSYYLFVEESLSDHFWGKVAQVSSLGAIYLSLSALFLFPKDLKRYLCFWMSK